MLALSFRHQACKKGREGRGGIIRGSEGPALGSTHPGFVIDNQLVPLNPDAFTAFTLLSANSPIFLNTVGLLDAAGSASGQINVPPGLQPTAFLTPLFHAFVAIDPVTLAVELASNAEPLLIYHF